MKKIIGSILLIIVGIVLFGKYAANNNHYPDYQVINYRLENKNLRLLVADTEDKREKGLMYYRQLDGVDGMIFLFQKKQILTFWNKNTYLDLKLFWLSDDRVVATSDLPSIEKSKEIVTVYSSEPVNKVIELPR